MLRVIENLRAGCSSAACAIVIALALPAVALAQADEPQKYWAVSGVASNDVLHMRDVPNADSKSVASIPYNARGLKHLGCLKNQPDFDRWVSMTKEQRRDATLEWCRVEYNGKQGWVAGRFLKPDAAPKH